MSAWLWMRNSWLKSGWLFARLRNAMAGRDASERPGPTALASAQRRQLLPGPWTTSRARQTGARTRPPPCAGAALAGWLAGCSAPPGLTLYLPARAEAGERGSERAGGSSPRAAWLETPPPAKVRPCRFSQTRTSLAEAQPSFVAPSSFPGEFLLSGRRASLVDRESLTIVKRTSQFHLYATRR